MKAWTLLATMIFLLPQILWAETLNVSFDEISELIAKHHKGVRVSIEQTKASEQKMSSVDASFLPKLSADIGSAHLKEASGIGETAPFWRLSAESNVYRGGRDEATRAFSENQVEIKKLDAQAFLRNQSFHARAAYIKLVYLEKILAQQIKSKGDFEILKKSIRIKINSGLMTKSSLDLLNIEAEDIDRQIILTRSELKSAKEELCLLLGIEHQTDIKLVTIFELPQSNSTPPSAISKSLPELQRLSLLSKRIDLDSAVKNEWWRPDVSVFASYASFAGIDRNEPGPLPDRELTLGLRLSIDLEGKQAFDRERFAKATDGKAIAYQRELLEDELKHHSEEYLRSMDTRLKMAKNFEESLNKSEKLTKKLLNEFDRGLVSSNDVFASIRSIQSLKKGCLEEELNYFLAMNSYDALTIDRVK